MTLRSEAAELSYLSRVRFTGGIEPLDRPENQLRTALRVGKIPYSPPMRYFLLLLVASFILNKYARAFSGVYLLALGCSVLSALLLSPARYIISKSQRRAYDFFFVLRLEAVQ